MVELSGTPRKLFKLIYKRYNDNNVISTDELKKLFPNQIELEEDLSYLFNLGLIDHDYNWHFILTAKGRIYFKLKTKNSIEILLKSIFCPIIVSFITALITMWLKGSS